MRVSYTKYDDLSRGIETGEALAKRSDCVHAASVSDAFLQYIDDSDLDEVSDALWPIGQDAGRYDVVTTTYTVPTNSYYLNLQSTIQTIRIQQSGFQIRFIPKDFFATELPVRSLETASKRTIVTTRTVMWNGWNRLFPA